MKDTEAQYEFIRIGNNALEQETMFSYTCSYAPVQRESVERDTQCSHLDAPRAWHWVEGLGGQKERVPFWHSSTLPCFHWMQNTTVWSNRPNAVLSRGGQLPSLHKPICWSAEARPGARGLSWATGYFLTVSTFTRLFKYWCHFVPLL